MKKIKLGLLFFLLFLFASMAIMFVRYKTDNSGRYYEGIRNMGACTDDRWGEIISPN